LPISDLLFGVYFVKRAPAGPTDHFDLSVLVRPGAAVSSARRSGQGRIEQREVFAVRASMRDTSMHGEEARKQLAARVEFDDGLSPHMQISGAELAF
jgi:hypothetical protein